MKKGSLESVIQDKLESGFKDRQIIIWYDEGETLKSALKKAIPHFAKAVFFEGSYLKVRATVEAQDKDFTQKWFVYVGDQPKERSWLKDYELFGLRFDLTLADLLADSFGLSLTPRIRELLSGKGGQLLAKNWNRFIDSTERSNRRTKRN